MHYKLLYPSKYLACCDLGGKEAKVIIQSFDEEEIVGTDGKKEKKPVLAFQGKQKRMICNVTNAKKIAKKFGTETNDWKGKEIIIYGTTCNAFGEQVECLRIK